MTLIPIWCSHYSLGDSILTLEEAGKTKPGNPVSICDLALGAGLGQVVLVDSRIDGFLEAYKHLSKLKIQLIYGLKVCVCADAALKDEASLATESNVIVFIRNTQGYNDLLRIQSRAWTDGFYYRGRSDWATLRALWTPNLTLALPYFSSFIARNALSMATIVPQLPVAPPEVTCFREIDSGLPFVGLLDRALDRYAAESGAAIQAAKSVYYARRADFRAYMTFRAIHNRASFDSPRVNHLASDRFSFEDYVRLTKEGA